MEHKYKYSKYDYAKIGIKKKVFLQKTLSDVEYQAYSRVFSNNTTELVNHLVDFMEKNYTLEQKLRYSDFNIDDYYLEWKVITPEGNFSNYETSC